MTKKEKIILMAVDFFLVLSAILLAVSIRFEGEVYSLDFVAKYIMGYEWLFITLACCCILSFYFFGLYDKLWRYAGMQELKNIFIANITAYIPAGGAALLTGGQYYSRSIIIIAWLLTLFFTGGIRFLLRWVYERTGPAVGAKKTLIVGAEDAGEMVLREIIRTPSLGYIPVGFIDDNPQKKRIRIHNVPVLGKLADLHRVADEKEIEQIIITLPQPSLIQKVIKECEDIKVEFKVVPGLSELIDGKFSVNKIRNVEIQDLLEREEVKLSPDMAREFIQGKTVLVTGAGGSIGSEICRQIVGFNPKNLILMGRGENSIYEIHLELKDKTSVPLITFIADIRNSQRMEFLFKEYQPQIIFHTAAHKHVPLMEHNINEAFSNNVLGTALLVDLAEKYRVESFTLLSTDKAVNPTSIMGSTKRLAEMVLLEKSRNETHCRFQAVRFGNVLDSRGSVVPTFRKQILAGGPVTITHPDMTRFFMTIPEAVQLVIQASSLGERGNIYILDMGKPVKIMDLARNMIRLSGFEPGKDIMIQVRGIRPGEKMTEELINLSETWEKTSIPKINRVVSPLMTVKNLSEELETLKNNLHSIPPEEMREKIKQMVPNYHPIPPEQSP